MLWWEGCAYKVIAPQVCKSKIDEASFHGHVADFSTNFYPDFCRKNADGDREKFEKYTFFMKKIVN